MPTTTLPDVAPGRAVPRILHHVYLNGGRSSSMPEPLRRNVEELATRNPGWEHRLYGDVAVERFIGEHYGAAMLDRYRRIDPDYGAARADLFRYLALYRHGGVYLDVKSRFTRPIDEVIRGDDVYVLSRWRNGPGEVHAGWGRHAELAHLPGGELQQWHVIAAPGHPFLRAVIERVVDGIEHYSARRTGVGGLGVFRLTGPIAYTLAIEPLIDRHPCRIVPDESALSLEYSVLPQSGHQRLFPRHYTTNTAPVVRRPGLGGWIDRGYLRAKKLKDRLRAGGAAATDN